MKELLNCVCCTSTNLRLILDLGNQSPANNYNVTDKFPLRLNVCLDCSHAQLSHAVNPDILFKDYPYMSGVSKTMLAYYERFADKISEHIILGESGSVLDIACNDGSQLDAFQKLGYLTFGIDPAENMVEIAKSKGHTIYPGYFHNHVGLFDILIAQNILAHVSDPYRFLMDAKSQMKEDSILVIQTSQSNMIKNHQFDTIYHEHISFFNKRSFSNLFNRVDLEVVDYWNEPDIHGGSDVYVLKKMPEISIQDYSDFSNRCYTFAKEFREKVEELQEDHYIACYGAAAKMINLIRFTGIEPNAIIDDTPTKEHQRICGLLVQTGETFLSKPIIMPMAIIPVWNFYDEIKAKCGIGFKYIKYIPEITIE